MRGNIRRAVAGKVADPVNDKVIANGTAHGERLERIVLNRREA